MKVTNPGSHLGTEACRNSFSVFVLFSCSVEIKVEERKPDHSGSRCLVQGKGTWVTCVCVSENINL
jgi:hypothetical protein